MPRNELPAPEPSPDELELPPLDGEGDDEPSAEGAEDEDLAVRDVDDPYDDAEAGDDDPGDELDASDEPSALADEDVGFASDDDEAPPEAPSESMVGDEDAPGVAGEDFGLIEGGDSIRDGGEEGFDVPEPELRVEDLPRLDAGDDDDLTVEETISDSLAASELRWDDRGFERLFSRAIGHVVRIRARGGLEATLDDGSVVRSLDGGQTWSAADHETEDDEALLTRGRARALLREGAGVLRAVDDGPLVLVESTAEATAFTLLDDGSILAATDTARGARLVRIPLDGAATVVAEEESTIEAVAVDLRSGIVYCGGAFGVSAYRPG